MEINSLKNKSMQKYINGLPAIWATARENVTLAEANKLYTINVDRERAISGDGFFVGIENGESINGIRCLKNGHILVSCDLMAAPRNGYIQMLLYINNYYICCFNMGKNNLDYGMQSMPPKLVGVHAGDIITMRVKSTLTGDVIHGDERTGITAFYVRID